MKKNEETKCTKCIRLCVVHVLPLGLCGVTIVAVVVAVLLVNHVPFGKRNGRGGSVADRGQHRSEFGQFFCLRTQLLV